MKSVRLFGVVCQRRRHPGHGAAAPNAPTGFRAGLPPALFFALATLPLSGFSQSLADAPVVELPPWVIEHRVDRLTAPAQHDSFAAALGATAVADHRAWTGRSVATLAEALRLLPGVVLQESFGGFEPPRLLIRGSGLDSAPTSRGVALLVDGLSFARADGAFHSGLLDPRLFSRLEVYRGTVHAALTPAVLGGVLNAVTPAAETPRTSLRLETGSFAAWRGGLTTGFTRAGTSAHFAGSFARQDGYRPQSRQQRAAAAAFVRHDFSRDRVLELSAYGARPDYDVPGPLTFVDALDRPRAVSAAVLRDQPHRRSSLLRVAAQFKAGPADQASAVGLAWQRWHDDFRQLQPNGGTDSTSDDLNGQATIARTVEIGSVRHHLLARGIFSAGTTDYQRYLNDRGTRGATFADLDLAAGTFALSLEDIVWLRPDLALGAGVTALHARRAIRGPVGLARTLELTDLSPRAGLHWQLGHDLSLHAAASHGAEPPTFDDLISVQGTHPHLAVRTRDLAAQEAATVELGFRGRTGRLSWSATVYRGGWRNEILKLADAAGLPRGAVNASRTVHQGIEAAARWRLLERTHRLSLAATGTWNRFRFDHDAIHGDNRLAGAPPFVGAAELHYENPRGWSAGLETTWLAGRTPVDHANRMHYGGHALLHARFSWKLTTHLTAHLTARNLADRRHVASTAGVLDLARHPATTAIFLPGAGRSLTLGLEWQ